MNESKLHELIYTDLMYTTLLFVHCLMVMVMFQWSGFCVRSTFLIKKKFGGASKNLLALTGDCCRRLCKFLSVCVCVCVGGNVQIENCTSTELLANQRKRANDNETKTDKQIKTSLK